VHISLRKIRKEESTSPSLNKYKIKKEKRIRKNRLCHTFKENKSGTVLRAYTILITEMLELISDWIRLTSLKQEH